MFLFFFFNIYMYLFLSFVRALRGSLFRYFFSFVVRSCVRLFGIVPVSLCYVVRAPLRSLVTSFVMSLFSYVVSSSCMSCVRRYSCISFFSSFGRYVSMSAVRYICRVSLFRYVCV